ncbi:hypothetical protein GCM10027414_04750 [Humibacter ginsengiterrae]
MGYHRRVTLRCLCDDLTSDWADANHRRAFLALRELLSAACADSDVVRVLESTPSPIQVAHPLVTSFCSSFESDDPSLRRESISGLRDPYWWKEKTTRWRGAATDAAIVGEGEVWLCAGGLRAEGEARDFYKAFMRSVEAHGPDHYLPSAEDRRYQAIEEKLARVDAWQEALRLSALICIAVADESVDARELHVPHPGVTDGSSFMHLSVEVERVSDGAGEELAELIIVVHIDDPAKPHLLELAMEAIRSVINPRVDDWRVTPGKGTDQIWSVLLDPEVLPRADSVRQAGELPEELQGTTLRLGIQAHYTQKDGIVDASVSGDPIRALCGTWFVPTSNPDHLPVCPQCAEVHAGLAD